jgi:hypothetical protein
LKVGLTLDPVIFLNEQSAKQLIHLGARLEHILFTHGRAMQLFVEQCKACPVGSGLQVEQMAPDDRVARVLDDVLVGKVHQLGTGHEVQELSFLVMLRSLQDLKDGVHNLEHAKAREHAIAVFPKPHDHILLKIFVARQLLLLKHFRFDHVRKRLRSAHF